MKRIYIDANVLIAAFQGECSAVKKVVTIWYTKSMPSLIKFVVGLYYALNFRPGRGASI